jgi:hypothetical protein
MEADHPVPSDTHLYSFKNLRLLTKAFARPV